MPKEKLRKVTEKTSRPMFEACGKMIGRGAVDQDGAECTPGGLWIFWADAHDQHGNVLGKERFARRCECLKTWLAENRTEAGRTEPTPGVEKRSGQAQPSRVPSDLGSLFDHKSRAAGQ